MLVRDEKEHGNSRLRATTLGLTPHGPPAGWIGYVRRGFEGS